MNMWESQNYLSQQTTKVKNLDPKKMPFIRMKKPGITIVPGFVEFVLSLKKKKSNNL